MSAHEWRYVEHGKVKHALRESLAAIAICGTGPRWFAPDWYGTGSQSEYEQAAALRPCKRCVNLGAKP